MKEYLAMWKNYANFSDRTTARGYWLAVLFNFLIGVIFGVATRFVPQIMILSSLYSLAVLIPGLAIAVRRLNDTGRSWTSIFFGLIPLVGLIMLLVFLAGKTKVEEGAAV